MGQRGAQITFSAADDALGLFGSCILKHTSAQSAPSRGGCTGAEAPVTGGSTTLLWSLLAGRGPPSRELAREPGLDIANSVLAMGGARAQVVKRAPIVEKERPVKPWDVQLRDIWRKNKFACVSLAVLAVSWLAVLWFSRTNYIKSWAYSQVCPSPTARVDCETSSSRCVAGSHL